MKVLQSIKNVQANTSDFIFRHLCRFNEKKKFQDSRRKAIAESYTLTAEQKGQIDELYLNHYGEKIDYMWHQNYAAHANKFDYRFFPEVLYIPEFERFQNENPAACRMCGDKNFLPIVAKAACVKMPHTIISCTNGILRDEDNHIISEAMANEILKSQSVTFVKPSTSSCSGQGCRLLSETDNYSISDNTLIIRGVVGGGTLVTT